MSAELVKKQYLVLGMDCADCALHVESAIKKLPGVQEVTVNFISGKMDIHFEQGSLDDERVALIVKGAGYVIQDAEFIKSTFIVNGMDCSQESTQIEKRLKKIAGIKDIKFNLINNELHIIHSISEEVVIAALRDLGFEANIAQIDRTSTHSDDKKYIITTSICGVFVFSGALFYNLSLLPQLNFLLIIIGILIGGYPIAIKGFKEARSLRLGMNFLMSLAILGAMLIGEWIEAGTVVFLFALAQLLESRTMQRARRSIGKLIDQKPKSAQVLIHKKYITKPVEHVKIGEIVAVKPGAAIPVDGTIIKGTAHVDQSTITGESKPVKLGHGDHAYAGTINKSGFLEIRAERVYSDSTFSRIISLVEEAQAQKAPKQAFVEKFSQYYTPIVIVMAILVAAIPPLFFDLPFLNWFYRALVLLVISCPCAFVISTPVTIISGLTNAMRNGILIKGGIYLENFAKLKAIAFDKTGTLTEGQPRVQRIYPLNDYSENEILALAASIEARSEHPIAEAIMTYAQNRKLKLHDVHEFSVLEGMGIAGTIENKRFLIGKHPLFDCDETVNTILKKVEDHNHSAVILGNEEHLLAIFSIADTIRNDSAEAIAQLRAADIDAIILLTGDNHRTAQAVAKKLNINAYYSELLPQEKVKTIKELKKNYETVVMVGDGVNDAPALAAADIGIAMGAGGSDVALETADIALMKDNLLKIPYLKKLSNKTLRIIKQNIFVALGLKFIFLLLAIPGWATLWMAVFADMGASLLVIFNGLRVLRDR